MPTAKKIHSISPSSTDFSGKYKAIFDYASDAIVTVIGSEENLLRMSLIIVSKRCLLLSDAAFLDPHLHRVPDATGGTA